MIKFRLLLVDDHPALRESIAAAAQDYYPRRLDVVGQCGDGITAVEQAKNFSPDVVLLDLGLPGKEGIQVLSEIRSACPSTRLVVFSMHDDQFHVVEAIRAGADDYLFKGLFGAKEVVDHLVQWMERESQRPDRVKNHVFSALRGLAADRVARGIPVLTETELRVLGLAAFQGLSAKEMAKLLRQGTPSLSARTIRKHLENSYEKLGARNQAHAVCLAIHYGLLSADRAEPRDSRE